MHDKYSDFTVAPDAPWKEDTFQRKPHGVRLSALLQSFEKPHVVAIKADWGTGKSTFLKRLKAQLELDGLPVVVVDAWKSDYLEDPILAFISALKERAETHAKAHPEGKAAKKIGAAVSGVAKFGSQAIVPVAKVLTAAVPGAPEVVNSGAELVRELGETLLGFERAQKDAQLKFRESLIELRILLTGGSSGCMVRRSIIIMIDELDRCRPTYAIKTLERIKHFFDVEGIQFVIATDKANLPAAVQSVYNVGPDPAERYLRRFIDIEYHLPPPESQNFTQALSVHFGLDRLSEPVPTEKWSNAYEYARSNLQPYSDIYGAYPRAVDSHEVNAMFPRLAKSWKLTLRDQAQSYNLISLILRSMPNSTRVFPQILVFLCCLRFHSYETYSKFVSGEILLEKLIAGNTQPIVRPDWLSSSDPMGADLIVFANVASESAKKMDTYLINQVRVVEDQFLSGAYRRLYVRVRETPSEHIPGFAEEIATLFKAFASSEDQGEEEQQR